MVYREDVPIIVQEVHLFLSDFIILVSLYLIFFRFLVHSKMAPDTDRQKVVIVGAGPAGALAALYAANRDDDVEVYELRDGMCHPFVQDCCRFDAH